MTGSTSFDKRTIRDKNKIGLVKKDVDYIIENNNSLQESIQDMGSVLETLGIEKR